MNVEIDYTNHRGERRIRKIRPIELRWELSKWHSANYQWILIAYCFEKKEQREFAMSGIHSWKQLKD